MKQYMAVRMTSANLPLIRTYDPHVTPAYYNAWMSHCLDAEKNGKKVYLLRCKDFAEDTTNYDVIYEKEFVQRWTFDNGAANNVFAFVTMRRRTTKEV